MKISDAIVGVVLFALAVFIFVYAYRLPPMPGQPYGPGAFPIAIALGLGTFSAVLAIRGLRARRPGTPWAEFAPWARSPGQLFNFMATLILVLVYVALSDTIGFIPMSIAILMTLFLLQRVPPLRGAAVAVGATLVLHMAFAELLRVPLPFGLLTDVLW
jgi:putative tricarboxylic transport membrane protein